MTDKPYFLMSDLAGQIPDLPSDSIVSRTFFQDDQMKAILFGFAPGQELSEHTASVPAIIHILSGEADVTLGEDHFDGAAGFWAHMDARLPHSIVARTPVKMLLIMFKKTSGS
jgi:quercetin dioxygenase-like cupin family protein